MTSGPPILDRLSPGARITIIRLRSLGDCVLTTPAIALLKAARPDLHLTVVAEARFASVFTGNPAIDHVVPMSTALAAPFRTSLCINFHGGPRSAWLTAASAARYRAGFSHFRIQWPYNVHVPRAQEVLGVDRAVHTAEHLASAMFFLGVPPSDIPRARLFATGDRSANPSTPYAVIHPFASAAGKSWPAASFLAAARHLRDQLGLEPVFIGAETDDASPFAEFTGRFGVPLEDVKSLIGGARLFVGNDSGPAHMAAAFSIPVVVLFGSSDPVTWAPWRTAAVTIAAGAGLESVPVERVTSAAAQLLASSPEAGR